MRPGHPSGPHGVLVLLVGLALVLCGGQTSSAPVAQTRSASRQADGARLCTTRHKAAGCPASRLELPVASVLVTGSHPLLWKALAPLAPRIGLRNGKGGRGPALDDLTVGWRHLVPATPASPYPCDDGSPTPCEWGSPRSFRKIIHLTVPPLDEIGLLAARYPNSDMWRFVAQRTGLPDSRPAAAPTSGGGGVGPRKARTHKAALRRAMRFWADWNELAADAADEQWRAGGLRAAQLCRALNASACIGQAAVDKAVAPLLAGHAQDDEVPFYRATWAMLADADGDLAARVKAVACARFQYDCGLALPSRGHQPPGPVATNTTGPSAAATADSRGHAFPLGMCTRVKNEGPYLREWLTFHLQRGVSRFHIYYDESSDNTLEVLEEFQARQDGLVVLQGIGELPGHEPGMQPFKSARHGFRDACLEQNLGNVQWLLFIDADEFVFPTAGPSLARHLQQNCLADMTHIPLHSRFFGIEGRVAAVEGLVINSSRSFGDYMLVDKRHVAMHKVIANTNCIREMATHYPVSGPSRPDCRALYPLNTHRQVATERGAHLMHRQCTQGMRFNHYAIKSRAEFLVKFRRRRLSLMGGSGALDHAKFVEDYGAEFLRDGLLAVVEHVHRDVRAMMVGRKRFPAAHHLGVVLQRFKLDFLSRDRNELQDDQILRFVPQLSTALEAQRNATGGGKGRAGGGSPAARGQTGA